MAKKLSRKDLKRPDEFVNRTMLAGQWIRDHQRMVAFVAGGIVVVVLALSLTIHLTQRSRVGSSEALWEAMDLQGAPLRPTKAANPDDEPPEPPRGFEVFDSEDDRAEAAAKAYSKLAEQREGQTAGQAAALGLASAQLELGQPEKARQHFEAFLADTGGLDHLKGLAIEGIGFTYEAEENYEQALAKYRELEKLDGDRHRDLAQYDQARMLEKLNKNAEAAELYRAIVRRSEQAAEGTLTNEYVRDRAESRLAVIDPGSDLLKARSKRRGADLLRQLMSGQGGGMPPGMPPVPPPAEDE